MMSIICIDQGNSSTKTGLFVDRQLEEVVIHERDKNMLRYVSTRSPAHIMMCSVSKPSQRTLRKLRKMAPFTMVDHTTTTPMRMAYETPHTLGPDRIAAVAGAHTTFKNSACLVIDAGTCITYDYLDREGIYRGGAIAPGIDMRFRALHKFTASLPAVARSNRHALIGNSTRSCMMSGVLNGVLNEVQCTIEAYREIEPAIRVALCGGDAKFFEKRTKGHIFALPNLVLTGLNEIYGVHVL